MKASIRTAAAFLLVASLGLGAPAHAVPCTTSSTSCLLTGGGTNSQGDFLTLWVAFNPGGGGVGTVNLNGDAYAVTCIIPGAPYPGNSLSLDWVEFFISAVRMRPDSAGTNAVYVRIGHNYKNVLNDDRFMVDHVAVPLSPCGADLLTVFPMNGGFSVS